MNLSDARMHTTNLTVRTTILLLVLAYGNVFDSGAEALDLLWKCLNETDELSGVVGEIIIVPSSVTVEFTCTAPDRPTWYLNGDFVVSNGTCYRSIVKVARDQTNNTAILTINDNHDNCNTLNVSCQILIAQQFLYVHNTTLIFQGPLLSPENVHIIHSVNSTIEWNPPYSTINNDIIHVYPHITQYTVYISDNCTGNIIVKENVTETRFTYDTSQDFPCPMYQVSAWNAGGEGELSEPVQGCISHIPQKVAAGSVVVHSTASQVLTMHINVTDSCETRRPNVFHISVMTTSRTVNTTTVRYDHKSGPQVTISIELLHNVNMCSLLVSIRAGNSAGMSSPTEIEVECLTTSETSDSTSPTNTTPNTTSSVANKVELGITVVAALTAVAIVLVAVVVTVRKCKKRLQAWISVKSSKKHQNTKRRSYEEPPQSIPMVAVSVSPSSENTTTNTAASGSSIGSDGSGTCLMQHS